VSGRKEKMFTRTSTQPPVKKRSRFSVASVLFASCFLACAQPNYAAARAKPKTMVMEESSTEKKLDFEENVMEKRSTENHDFVLTNKRLLIFSKKKSQGPITLIESRKDISKLMSEGIVDWEVSESHSFFLTGDKKLRVIPHNSGNVSVYPLEFETAGMGNARMVYQSGFLFIAPPSGKILICSDNLEWGTLSNHFEDTDASFSVSNDGLFFGNEIESSEIRIKGNKLADVSIFR
jgi:hypothetical protein